MTCKMLCLIKGQSGSVSLAAYPISTVVPLDLSSASSCTCQHCMWITFCQILNHSIFSRLHVRVFDLPFFWKENRLDIHLWYELFCGWSRANMALFILQRIQYPLCLPLLCAVNQHALACVAWKLLMASSASLRKSTMCCCGCLCASLQTWIPVDNWAAVFPTVVSCHWWRRKGLIRVAWQTFVQASCHRFESGPGVTRV